MWGVNQTISPELEVAKNRAVRAIMDAVDEQIVKPYIERYYAERMKLQGEQMTDQQLTDHMVKYIDNFINRRFPEGLEGRMREIQAEIILEAFQDGCRFSEEVREESSIILPPH